MTRRALCFILAALLVLALLGCNSKEVPRSYSPEELVGKSAAEIIAIYGDDYTEVVPEGDPPYFHYGDAVPYRFIGTAEDAVIYSVTSQVTGCEMLPGISVGDRLASLEAAATALEGYEYFPTDEWYDEGGGSYSWVLLTGSRCQYICYIQNDVLASFECWLMNE